MLIVADINEVAGIEFVKAAMQLAVRSRLFHTVKTEL